MMNGNNIEHIKAYTELNCLLEYFPKEYINKLPTKLLTLIKNKSENKYNINIDLKNGLENQNISKKTKDFLTVLKYNFWSTDEERETLNEVFNNNEKVYQEMLQVEFNPDNIFKKKMNDEIYDNEHNKKQEIVIYKESAFKEIINKILTILHLNK